MSKSMVTWLFAGAVLAMVVGLVIVIAATATALAGGIVTIGGPTVITVDGPAFAGTAFWLVVAALAIAGASLAAIASWIGALLNTVKLEDKTWFIVLLVLGLASLGWLALAAYILAGPDATGSAVPRPRAATTPGT